MTFLVFVGSLFCADNLGFYRTAADLEPIQPLLQKHMHCLEFDLFDQRKVGKWSSAINPKATQDPTLSSASNRPRSLCTRESLWMGLKTLYVDICFAPCCVLCVFRCTKMSADGNSYKFLSMSCEFKDLACLNHLHLKRELWSGILSF